MRHYIRNARFIGARPSLMKTSVCPPTCHHFVDSFISSSKILIQLFLDVEPQVEDFGISKRKYLSTEKAANSLLAISPPPAVRTTCPRPSTTFRPSGWTSVRQHESQSPALRRVSLDWVDLGNGVREIGFGSWYALTRELGDFST
jgi:hypothetical protein